MPVPRPVMKATERLNVAAMFTFCGYSTSIPELHWTERGRPHEADQQRKPSGRRARNRECYR